MFYCPTLDCSFLAVKELSEYEGGNYKNPKLSFLFWDECRFDAWRHGCIVNDQNLPLSGFSVFPPSEKVCISCPLVTRSTWPQSLCSSGSDSPRRENLPKPQLLSDHARPHCSLSPDHPSKLLSLLFLHPSIPPSLFPLFSQEQPAGLDLLWSLCCRAKPSLLAGRAASFDWVLVRAGRLVTGYLQRGQWAWALWSSGK